MLLFVGKLERMTSSLLGSNIVLKLLVLVSLVNVFVVFCSKNSSLFSLLGYVILFEDRIIVSYFVRYDAIMMYLELCWIIIGS